MKVGGWAFLEVRHARFYNTLTLRDVKDNTSLLIHMAVPGAALLGIGAVSWYMYTNKTLPGTVLQLCMCFRDVQWLQKLLVAFSSPLQHNFNIRVAEHSGQTSSKVGWQQYSGPTHANTDTSKPKGPEQSSKEH